MRFSKNYLFSLALWQITSTEKLKAKANAMACQSDSYLKMATNIITKQNKLAITVSAFFSDKYLFMVSRSF
jgi:hypothetical protein